MEDAGSEDIARDHVVGETVDAAKKSSISGVEATTAAVPNEAVPVPASDGIIFSLAPPAEDSSDSADEDTLPAINGGFGYWSQMLNVTKVAEPLPPLTPVAKTAAARTSRPHWRGNDHYDNRRAGPRGGKGSWKGRPISRPDDVGSFVAWAKDPSAGDGRRGSSRSPRRHHEERNMEDFMSWAMEHEDEIAPKEESGNENTQELGSFLAWASAGGDHSEIKTEDNREKGEDALMEKEDRRLTDEASEDEAPSKRCRPADALTLPKAEKVEAEIAGLKKEIAAEEKSLAATAEAQMVGNTKAENNESDEELDLAAMQRWRRLEDEVSDDDNEALAKLEFPNLTESAMNA